MTDTKGSNRRSRRDPERIAFARDQRQRANEFAQVDGKDHLTEQGKQRDRQRDRFFEQQGFEILRINGYQVTQDARAVRQSIEEALENRLRNRSQEPSVRHGPREDELTNET